VRIPYPEKYWTAEVFPYGFRKGSSAYLFSVDRKGDEKLVEKGAAPQIMGQEDRGEQSAQEGYRCQIQR